MKNNWPLTKQPRNTLTDEQMEELMKDELIKALEEEKIKLKKSYLSDLPFYELVFNSALDRAIDIIKKMI
jgi:hypothetical protein